jgi:hypothetical protein
LSIPVVLTEMSRMQVEIVKGIAADAGDIDAHEVGDYGDVDDAVDATGAPVVVTGAGGRELPERYDALLYRHPRLSVLSIGGEGSAALHELRPHRSPLGNISPAELVATIRAAARARAGRPV